MLLASAAMLSVIAGAASDKTLRALVISDQSGTPMVSAKAQDGSTPSAAWVALSGSPKLNAELARRRVTLRRLELSNIAAGSRVTLDVRIGNDRQQLALQTLPTRIPSEGICFTVATCYYDGFGYGDPLRAALSRPLLGLRPSFQVWAGDNLYMDVPVFRPSTSPHGDTVQRYLDYFTQSPYRFARALHPTFNTYDDHELWNNFPEAQVWLGRSYGSDRGDHIDAARKCIEMFQASVNPKPVADGFSYRFELPPVSFFVADMRSFRTKHDDKHARMMTERDFAALIAWAAELNGPGVLVLGQPLWIEAGGYGDYNTPHFRAEYQAIWKALREARYDVLVLTGDVHHSRFLKLSFADAPTRAVYEFCTSPASHIPGIASTFGLGHSQDHGTVTPPTRVGGSGQKVKAQFLFGTRAPNSFGVVRLDPLPTGEVRVGGGFLSYGSNQLDYAKNEVAPGLPPMSIKQYSVCHEPRICTLRLR